MKRSAVFLLMYYLLVAVSEYVIGSNFYNYEDDSWKFIIFSQVAFSALMVLPAPLLLASRFFRIESANRTGHLSNKPWLAALFIASLIASIGISVLSYQRAIASKEIYDATTEGVNS